MYRDRADNEVQLKYPVLELICREQAADDERENQLEKQAVRLLRIFLNSMIAIDSAKKNRYISKLVWVSTVCGPMYVDYMLLSRVFVGLLLFFYKCLRFFLVSLRTHRSLSWIFHLSLFPSVLEASPNNVCV